MKTIRYKVIYGREHSDEIVQVNARDINSGYAKVIARAVRGAREVVRAGGNARDWEISRVEFSEIL